MRAVEFCANARQGLRIVLCEEAYELLADVAAQVPSAAAVLGAHERPELEPVEWVKRLGTSLREASRAVATNPKEHFRTHVPRELAGSLWQLFAMGLVDEARTLMAEVPLDNFAPEDDESMTRAEWWGHFLTACRKSQHWEALCRHHPALRELK